MFTGLVEEIGHIIHIEEYATETKYYRKFRIACNIICEDITIGDSINVNGACQTVVAHSDPDSDDTQWFEIESLQVTLEKTNFSAFEQGTHVNLERALQLGDRLGGHIVSGHVQGLGIVENIESKDNNMFLYITVAKAMRPYIIKEGSITIDGISLTISDIQGYTITINIIGHTLQATNIQYMKKHDTVNIECDIMAKYAESILLYHNSKG